MTEQNPRAVIGDNSPPPSVETWADHAEELFELAEGVGEITTDEQAATVAQLKTDATKAEGDIKKAITAERKPHTDAANAISASFKPIVDRVSLVKSTASNLLTPWLKAKEAERAEAERQARLAAREAEEAARKAAMDESADDIASQEAAANAEQAAEREKTRVRKIAAEKPKATTDARAVSLRTVGYDVDVTDWQALGLHIAKHHKDAMRAFMVEWAEKHARATKGDPIPGCTVEARKVAA